MSRDKQPFNYPRDERLEAARAAYAAQKGGSPAPSPHKPAFAPQPSPDPAAKLPRARPKPAKPPEWWRLPLMALGGTFLLAWLGLALLGWALGEPTRVTYSRIMGPQIDWQHSQRPSLRPLLAILSIPRVDVPDEDTLPDRLLPPGGDGAEAGLDPLADLPLQSLKEQLALAGDAVTVVLPPGNYTDCLVIKRDVLILKSAVPYKAQISGVCRGKAALVAGGRKLIVDGLAFRDVRAPDKNGAGIRVERGEVIVRNSLFYNNENGILGGNPLSVLRVEKSRFLRNGSCYQRPCGHGIYALNLKRLVVKDSVFQIAAGGHHVKSRALESVITGTRFDDRDGIAAYLIDLPNGGNAEITGNTFLKGEATRHRCCIIRVGAEGLRDPPGEVRVENNEASSPLPITFLVWNDGEVPVTVSGNRTHGRILASWGEAH